MNFKLIIFLIDIIFTECPIGWIGRKCDKVMKPKWVGVGKVGNNSIELSWKQKNISVGDRPIVTDSNFKKYDSDRNEIGMIPHESSSPGARERDYAIRTRRNSISNNNDGHQSNHFDSIEINLIPRIGKKSEEKTIVLSIDPKSSTIETSNLLSATEYRAVICNRIGNKLSEPILIDIQTKGIVEINEPINECKLGTHQCSENAACEYLKEAGYRCTCDDGFVGDGFKCQEIDECSLGTHECHKNAICINTPGFYKCICRHGFYGNGRFCKNGKKLKNLRRRKRTFRNRVA